MRIAEIVALAGSAGINPCLLVEALKLGSASSSALTLLNTMVTPDTVDHLSSVEAADMEIFRVAMKDAGMEAEPNATLWARQVSAGPDCVAQPVRQACSGGAYPMTSRAKIPFQPRSLRRARARQRTSPNFG